MSRDRMPGGGFQSPAITIYDVPGDTNAACDDPHHERADRKQPVVHERSIIEIELPVCSLLDLNVFLKRMGLSGLIGRGSATPNRIAPGCPRPESLIGQPQADVVCGIISIRCPHQPFEVDAGHPDAEEEHRVAHHHHDDAEAGRKPPDFFGPQLGRSLCFGPLRDALCSGVQRLTIR